MVSNSFLSLISYFFVISKTAFRNKYSISGLRDLGIPKLDPIEIPKINIGTQGRTVQVHQRYTNVKVTGFSNATVSKAQ